MVKDRGEVVEVEHVGSAHTDAELALLLAAAGERLAPGQQAFDLGELAAEPARLGDTTDWTPADPARPFTCDISGSGPAAGRAGRWACVVGTSALMLWNVLIDAYVRLGFDTLADKAFKAMVCARGHRGDLEGRHRPCAGRDRRLRTGGAHPSSGPWPAASSATTAGS